jgi:hypothetical protein
MPDEYNKLAQEFVQVRDAMIAKHDLDLRLPKRGFSRDTRWLAHHLWGRYARNRLYRNGQTISLLRLEYTEWLGPPKEMYLLRDRLNALKVLLRLPTSLIQDDIKDFIYWRKPNRNRWIADVLDVRKDEPEDYMPKAALLFNSNFLNQLLTHEEVSG